MCEVNKEEVVDRTGVFVITGEVVICENPVCNKRATVQDLTTDKWFCRECYDFLYDAVWGFGHKAL